MAAHTLSTAAPSGAPRCAPAPARRTLLAATSALATVGVPVGPAVAAAAPNPDPSLLAARERLRAANDARVAANADPTVKDTGLARAVEAWSDALEGVVGLPAATPAGVCAKAAVARTAIEQNVPIRIDATVEEFAEMRR